MQMSGENGIIKGKRVREIILMGQEIYFIGVVASKFWRRKRTKHESAPFNNNLSQNVVKRNT